MNGLEIVHYILLQKFANYLIMCMIVRSNPIRLFPVDRHNIVCHYESTNDPQCFKCKHSHILPKIFNEAGVNALHISVSVKPSSELMLGLVEIVTQG